MTKISHSRTDAKTPAPTIGLTGDQATQWEIDRLRRENARLRSQLASSSVPIHGLKTDEREDERWEQHQQEQHDHERVVGQMRAEHQARTSG